MNSALAKPSLQVPLAPVGAMMLPVKAHKDSNKLTVSKHEATLRVVAVDQYRRRLE